MSVSSPGVYVRPTSGPSGTPIGARGTGLNPGYICARHMQFEDSAGTVTLLKSLPINTDSFLTTAMVPANAAPGPGDVVVVDLNPNWWQPLHCVSPLPITVALAPFTVTQVKPSNAGLVPSIQVRPISGPAGTLVHLRGTGFPALVCIHGIVYFTDSLGGAYSVGSFWGYGFDIKWPLPEGVAVGSGMFTGSENASEGPHICLPPTSASAPFRVTP